MVNTIGGQHYYRWSITLHAEPEHRGKYYVHLGQAFDEWMDEPDIIDYSKRSPLEGDV